MTHVAAGKLRPGDSLRYGSSWRSSRRGSSTSAQQAATVGPDEGKFALASGTLRLGLRPPRSSARRTAR
jgi:hypothetical protein